VRAPVPCNGCRLCCINDMIILHPEKGDRPAEYLTVEIRHPFTWKPAKMLQHKPNGDCIYLGETGCTIHDRAPLICREYDCRRQYLSMTRAERRKAVAIGLMDRPKLEAGRQRLHTLKGAAA
jgi:Fe-S-cluster containining protein